MYHEFWDSTNPMYLLIFEVQKLTLNLPTCAGWTNPDSENNFHQPVPLKFVTFEAPKDFISRHGNDPNTTTLKTSFFSLCYKCQQELGFLIFLGAFFLFRFSGTNHQKISFHDLGLYRQPRRRGRPAVSSCRPA